jgi:hypothetical protein
MSASEKKNYIFKFYVERTYEVEFVVPAPDQETADQMAKDMADNCEEFPNDMIDDDNDSYEVGEIEVGFVRENDTTYKHTPSRQVAAWCEMWEEEQKEDEEEEVASE